MRHTRASKYSDSKFGKTHDKMVEKFGYCLPESVFNMRNNSVPDAVIASQYSAFGLTRRMVAGVYASWAHRVAILSREAEVAAMIKADYLIV